MAEGFLRAYAGDRLEVQSAGTKATAIHPLAVRAMREVGIDISAQRSKSVDDVGEGWDVGTTNARSFFALPRRRHLIGGLEECRRRRTSRVRATWVARRSRGRATRAASKAVRATSARRAAAVKLTARVARAAPRRSRNAAEGSPQAPWRIRT